MAYATDASNEETMRLFVDGALDMLGKRCGNGRRLNEDPYKVAAYEIEQICAYGVAKGREMERSSLWQRVPKAFFYCILSFVLMLCAITMGSPLLKSVDESIKL